MNRGFSPARVAALLRKELHALFGQPLLWVVGTFFLLLAGYYHQAMSERSAGRATEAAALIDEAKARFGSDPEVQTLAAESLGVDIAPRLKTVKVEEPPKRKAGIKVKTVAELVDKLRNEAGVI